MSCRASPADLDSEEQKLVPKNKNKQTNKQLHLKEELNREEHTCIINFKRLHRKQLASEVTIRELILSDSIQSCPH